MAGLVGPQCKSAGEAIAAASALAGMKGAPNGMKPKISVTGVNQVGEMFAASVSIEYVPDPAAVDQQDNTATATDDGKGEEEGDSSTKSSEATDVLAPTDVQKKALDAGVMDMAMLPREDLPEPEPVRIGESMEQLPDPDNDLLRAEVNDNSSPQSAEAIEMAEQMKTEFNDQPDDLLVIGNSSTTPEQHTSNEAHNQRELDAEETRREQAQAEAAIAQKEALALDPLT